MSSWILGFEGWLHSCVKHLYNWLLNEWMGAGFKFNHEKKDLVPRFWEKKL